MRTNGHNNAIFGLTLTNNKSHLRLSTPVLHCWNISTVFTHIFRTSLTKVTNAHGVALMPYLASAISSFVPFLKLLESVSKNLVV